MLKSELIQKINAVQKIFTLFSSFFCRSICVCVHLPTIVKTGLTSI